jgi:heptosyltransferase II
VKDGLLIVLPNWVGDGALAAPAVRALQTAHPDRPLFLLGTARSAPLYGRWPSHALLEWEGKGVVAILRLARRLRMLGAGEALILAASFRSALVTALAGIPRRIGHASDGRGALLSDVVAEPGRDTHLATQYLALAARMGADRSSPLDPEIPVGADELESADLRLRSLGLDGGTTIALCPGATYGETKRWPADHWGALARRLSAHGFSILVMGGSDETAIAGRIREAAGETVRTLAGELSLRESLAIFGRLVGAVSNDSGAMHLAAAAGCPVVGIFGSTNPSWTGPLGSRSRHITLRLACSPCYAKECPTQIECLRDLGPDAVETEVRALLEGKEAEG